MSTDIGSTTVDGGKRIAVTPFRDKVRDMRRDCIPSVEKGMPYDMQVLRTTAAMDADVGRHQPRPTDVGERTFHLYEIGK